MAIPEFIVRLRAKVGHDELWLAGATAVVLREGDAGTEVLLVRRADDGAWSPVCGIIDPGEEAHDAALREVLEEAGVVAEVERLVWVSVTEPVVYDNGDRTRYLDHTFRCRWSSGEPHAADEENTDARFFPVGALPPMSGAHADRVRVALDDRPEARLGRLR